MPPASGTIQQAIRTAITHHQAGRLAEAEQIYRQVLIQQPEHPEALHMLGVLAGQVGREDIAIDLICRAIKINPLVAEYHNNLSGALRKKGRLDEALSACREALRLKPSLPEVHNNYGNVLKDKGQLDEAIVAYRQAIKLKPDLSEAYNNLGTVLNEKDQIDDAIAAYHKAIELKPDLAEAHNNLAISLRGKGKPDEAMAAARRALVLKPDYSSAYTSLANSLTDKLELDAAVQAHHQAIRLDPARAIAHWNYGLTLMMKGEFTDGFAQYEWRWKSPGFAGGRMDAFGQPPWDGSDLRGRTILVWYEQGMGDTIQFVRYIPLLARQGARVIVQCQPELKSLLREVAGAQQFVTMSDPLPAFDTHIPMLSIPLRQGTTIATIPADVPYLKVDPARQAAWQSRLASQGDGLKVGIVWAGNPKHKNDFGRSLAPEALTPLIGMAGIHWYSLQKGLAAGARPLAGLTDWTGELYDFSDTAALIANLDLVISVDTAVAHLAGALATPTWTLLPFAPDWRWMLDRDDSSWYPTMRLFRQPRPGDWTPVIERVGVELKRLVASRGFSVQSKK